MENQPNAKHAKIITLAPTEAVEAIDTIADDAALSAAARQALVSFDAAPMGTWGDAVNHLATDLEILAAFVATHDTVVDPDDVGMAIFRASKRLRGIWAMAEAEREREREAAPAETLTAGGATR
jgi:hypothetical protein